MLLPTNYFYAEMLANLISQARAVLQSKATQDLELSTKGTMFDVNSIHFGASRGSGHSTAIEALTHVYRSDIVCASRRHLGFYDGRAKDTKLFDLDEALKTGQEPRDVEVVFIDNWLDIMRIEGEKMWKKFEDMSHNYDRKNTVFVFVH